MKTVDEIAEEALRAMDRVLRNEIQAETCPEKKEKAEWKKTQVREKVVAKLQDTIGPSKLGPSILK